MNRRIVFAASSLAFLPLAVALAAVATGSAGSTSPSGTTLVQLPATTVVAPAPTPSPTPTKAVVAPTPAPSPTPALTALPPLDLSDMRLWNWNGKWHASEWNHEFSQIPWRYTRVARQANGDVKFRLDATGAPQLQAQNGTPARDSGLWEVQATLPKLRDGMVVAPLWLYDPASKDEIDFEFVGRKGLDVSIHAYPNGVHLKNTVRLYAGQDLSGKKLRLGIKLDNTAGTAIMMIDGKVVHTWSRAGLGWFVSEPVKPFMEMWAANSQLSWLKAWTGTWTALPSGDSRTMIVHGYRYTPIA